MLRYDAFLWLLLRIHFQSFRKGTSEMYLNKLAKKHSCQGISIVANILILGVRGFILPNDLTPGDISICIPTIVQRVLCEAKLEGLSPTVTRVILARRDIE